jgi:hypothetical protein
LKTLWWFKIFMGLVAWRGEERRRVTVHARNIMFLEIY